MVPTRSACRTVKVPGQATADAAGVVPAAASATVAASATAATAARRRWRMVIRCSSGGRRDGAIEYPSDPRPGRPRGGGNTDDGLVASAERLGVRTPRQRVEQRAELLPGGGEVAPHVLSGGGAVACGDRLG